ncbi:MAG TPA: PAS domain-containing protein [Burkholderiales bacterium]|nr:PAS domain-containing protein [Burkholderiales bacterium]
MSFANSRRREDAPALARLLGDAAMARAALGACGFPIAILDATAPARPVSYVNDAFEAYFGCRADEARGRALGALILRGDEALVHRMLAESSPRRTLKAWSKDGAVRHVDVSLTSLRTSDGRIAHWVLAFADRSELERLRTELDSLRTLAAAA